MRQVTDAEIIQAIRSTRPIVDSHTAGWPPWASREDALAIAALAVVEAAERYDPSHGVPFAGFVRQRVKGALLDDGRWRDYSAGGGRYVNRYPATETVSLQTEVGKRNDERGELGDRLEEPGAGPAEQYADQQAGRNLMRRWRLLSKIQRQVSALMFRQEPNDGSQNLLARQLGLTSARLTQIKTAIRAHMAADDDESDAD